jgi:hypothetical protein
MDYIQLILVLLQGAATLLSGQTNKTAESVGADIQAVDQVVLAVLKKSAEVKGVTVDWNDPAAVAAYVQTLPEFVPISEPIKPPPITQ